MKTTLLAMMFVFVLQAAVAAAGPDPAHKCVAAKITATAKRFVAISKCRAKAVLAGTAVDAGCLQKAEDKFRAAFTKAESGGVCTLTGDAPAIDGAVGTCTDAINDDLARRCGDGAIAPSEACDDRNATSGDGCSATCAIETGFGCTGEPSLCASTCGDGVVASDEACDDAGRAGGDGCSASCAIETGYACSGTPSSCTPICGDGRITGSEACDDGAATSGDGCSATCALEGGWACGGEPTACTCTIVPIFRPDHDPMFFGPVDYPLDASASYSGCGLPLQYFWSCMVDFGGCPDGFFEAANANGNTNATPTAHFTEGSDSWGISLTVCFAGTSNCAPPIGRLFQSFPLPR
jgi:cysteine-rich repeat protein